MEPVEAELFTPGGNGAILRLPGRRFPGVLVQGDSLSILLSMAEAVETLLEEGRTPEAAEEVGDLADSLAEMLRRYEAALKDHGIERPYNGAFKRLG
jgi:hypothetical protein